MNLFNKTVGIWGFGIVGKAAAQFLHSVCAKIDIIDNRELSISEKGLLQNLGATYQTATDIQAWIQTHDFIVASPGIDVRPYAKYRKKFISELDLFYEHFHKPTIAITGSAGKTTVTTLLSELCKARYPHIWTGGNIGNSMLDALHNNTCDAALLELSSFQLEHCTTFAPDIALWTNFHPNHLDRHGTEEAYFNAKFNIIAHQSNRQHAIVPLELLDMICERAPKSTIHYFTHTKPEPNTLRKISSYVFYVAHDAVIAYHQGNETPLITIQEIPTITFIENWILVCGLLHLLKISSYCINANNMNLPEHRLEKCAIINGIDFYNDSKATISEATIAAVKQLKTYNRPIRLFIGGLSKGVDRSSLIAEIGKDITAVYCFGKEHKELSDVCTAHSICHYNASTLSEAYKLCIKYMQSGDIILLSPAGSSFDEFSNYEERGKFFKNMINEFKDGIGIR